MAKGTVNKVIVLGRLGQDPDMRATAAGTQVANLNVATTEMGAADQSGNRQEQTEWHRVVLFGKTAEIAGQYLKKGAQVYIEGRLQTRKWQDQSGNDCYSTEIVGREMQFIGGKSDNLQKNGQQDLQHQGQNFGQGNGQAAQGVTNPQPVQGFGQANGKPAPQPQNNGFGQPMPGQHPSATPGHDEFIDDIPF